MSRVTLDTETIQKLIETIQPVEICDNSGKIFGRFTPQVEPNVSEAELREVLKEKGGRTLAEIMTELDNRS